MENTFCSPGVHCQTCFTELSKGKKLIRKKYILKKGMLTIAKMTNRYISYIVKLIDCPKAKGQVVHNNIAGKQLKVKRLNRKNP